MFFNKHKQLKREKEERMRQEALVARAELLLRTIPISPYVSEEHKYCYMVTPKAACTTVRRALLAWEGYGVVPELRVHETHLAGAPMRLENHSFEVAKPALISPDYYRFCFVRNPYDRTVSGWKSKIKSDHPQYVQLQKEIKKALGCKVVGFKEFVEYLVTTDDPKAKFDEHWIDQTELLFPQTIEYSRVGRFETFNDDFTEILGILGAPADIVKLGRARTNFTAKIKSPYDQELADWVFDLNHKSFQAYGYHRDSWQ